LASFLRLYKINFYPAGFNADEAAIGYNAYSLIQTGKDEHGDFWPIHFKSFGDFKPGGYFYLVLPFVKILGLTEFAVRLPSVFLGILSVLLIYLLVLELFQSFSLALLSSFFLAISPWHLHFSRGGWETNAATTFILFGAWFFLKGIKNPKLFLFSILSFVFSMYTYHSARVIVPFLVFGLLIFYRKFWFNQLKWLFISGILGIILLLPLIFSFFSKTAVSRFSGVGFLSDSGPFWRANELRGEHQNWNAPQIIFLHNKFLNYGLSFLENYFDHFQGEFLFLSGDEIERNRIPGNGQMYLFDILLLPLGIYFFLKNKPKNWQVVFWWLAVSPLAAAMTFQTPHAIRAHNMVIPLVIISVYGFYNMLLILRKISSKSLFTIYYLLFTIFIIWNVSYFLHQYFVHYPKAYPAAWEYGMKDLVSFISPIKDRYLRIYITDQYDQPYILFLFYLKYPPDKFQKEVILTPRDKFGFSTVLDFDKFHFEKIEWAKIKEERNILVCGTDKEIPNDVKILKEIDFLNGEPAFKCVEIL
jgi:4-amino-4-deoxy-L-arabinose transferase-like glycosyltransferase